ncbi:hypothetical protein PPT99_004338 [Salmonella enterica]|nr:hypothetical protein [Salmonella enterica]
MPPPGAALARCPARDRRQGAHCCAGTPRAQAASQRRAIIVIASVAATRRSAGALPGA